jgi:hypothetical protein
VKAGHVAVTSENTSAGDKAPYPTQPAVWCREQPGCECC